MMPTSALELAFFRLFLISFDASPFSRVRALAAPASSPVSPRTHHHAVAPQAPSARTTWPGPTCWLCEDGVLHETILEVGNRRAKAYKKHAVFFGGRDMSTAVSSLPEPAA